MGRRKNSFFVVSVNTPYSMRKYPNYPIYQKGHKETPFTGIEFLHTLAFKAREQVVVIYSLKGVVLLKEYCSLLRNVVLYVV